MTRTFGNTRFKLYFAATALSLAVTAAAAGLQIARMKMPAELATESLRLHASGYGGANRGRFEVGGYSGTFTRIESRFAVFDPLYAANRGKSAFTLEGFDVDGTIAGECAFKERVITVGVLTFDAEKLAYVCAITDSSGAGVGSLTLGEPKPDGFKERMLARAARQGVADIGDVRIGITSVHHYEGSRLSSQTPVGYVLTHDSATIGALELTDSDPTIFVHSGAKPEVRRAALIAALGLSVLRDPANSMLGD